MNKKDSINSIDSYLNIMLRDYLDLQNNKFQNKNILEQQLGILVKMSQFTNLKLNSVGNNLNDYLQMGSSILPNNNTSYQGNMSMLPPSTNPTSNPTTIHNPIAVNVNPISSSINKLNSLNNNNQISQQITDNMNFQGENQNNAISIVKAPKNE